LRDASSFNLQPIVVIAMAPRTKCVVRIPAQDTSECRRAAGVLSQIFDCDMRERWRELIRRVTTKARLRIAKPKQESR
jgi:hypothetical protein